MQVVKSKNQFFSAGFKPFFLLTAWTAVLLPTFWISIYSGYLGFHSTLLSPAMWHSHEMIFAFTWALMAGFILTASANWTGKPAIAGNKLKILVGMWLVGRVGIYFPLAENDFILIILHSLFPVTFIGLMIAYLRQHARQLYVFAPLLVSFFVANLLMLLGALYKNEWMIIGQDFGLALIKFLLILMTGRLLPFFSRGKFKDLNIIKNEFVEKIVIAGALVLCVPYFKNYIPEIYSVFSIVVALGLGVRIYNCKFWQTFEEPMLAILNVGVMWLIVHLILEAVVIWNPSVLFTKAPLHALTAGALGTISLGIMTRVSLAHSGRPVKADKVLIAAFISMFVGAFFRVYIPVFQPELFAESLHHASGWWCLAYCLFLYRMTPVLMK